MSRQARRDDGRAPGQIPGRCLPLCPGLASHVERTSSRTEQAPLAFEQGDLRVVPNVDGAYFPDQDLSVYLQAYGLGLDPRHGTNRISLQGRILREGQPFGEIPPQYPYPALMDRQSFTVGLPLHDFDVGSHTVIVDVVDELTDTKASISVPFEVRTHPLTSQS